MKIPDKEKDYQRYMLFVLAIIWFFVTEVIVIAGFYFFPQHWLRWATLMSVSFFITVFNLTLNHLGYVRLASYSLIIMLWLFITIPCYSGGGIMAPGILTQMSVILTAGFLLGWRGGLAIGLLSLGADFCMAYIELIGSLPKPTVMHNAITRWISSILPFGTILALQYYATNHLRTSLIALQQEIAKRQEVEKTKDQIVYNLGERVKELKALYEVSRLLQIEDQQIEEVFNQIVDIIVLGWQFPENTCACIIIGNTKYATSNYKSSKHSLHAEMTTKNGTKVSIEVAYLKEMPTADEGVFLKEERNLINALVEIFVTNLERGEAIEKIKQSESLLRKITSQVPGNTYMFTIDDNGLPNFLFINQGTDLSYPKTNLQDNPEHTETLKELLHNDDHVKFNKAMKEASQTLSRLSIQYRIVINEQIRWRWLQAVPEKDKDGNVIWYGATSDITQLVDYIASIEQILFDISHVMRRPITTMTGLTGLIIEQDFDEKEIKGVVLKLHAISKELDKFIHELNDAYSKKRQETKHNIDISPLIDKRNSLFND